MTRALDFSVAGLTPDPLSEAYRPRPEHDPRADATQAWDASELAPLLVAYGLAPFGARYSGRVREAAQPYSALGLPKILAWKSGLRAKPRSKDMARDPRRERLLFDAWRAGHAAAHGIEGRGWVRPIEALVPELFPALDRRSLRIASSPSGLARDSVGRLTTIRVRATHEAEPEPQWHRVIEAHADMLAVGAARALIVIGEYWAAEYREPGEVRTRIVEPDTLVSELLRAVAVEAWTLVEALRQLGEGEGKRGRQLWEASCARLRAQYGRDDDAQALISAAAGEIDGIDELLVRQVG